MASPPRVLVTRAPQQASALADRLRELGCEPVLVPTIETVEPKSFGTLDDALRKLRHPTPQTTFHWLLFTSANAVDAFVRRRVTTQADIQLPDPVTWPHLAAIGGATARALEAAGLPVDLLPPQAIAESFVGSLLAHVRQPDGTPTHFLIVRAEEARELLPETLRAAGAEVTVAPAYRTVVPQASMSAIRDLFAGERPPLDALTFTSSSSVRNLLVLCETAGLELPVNLLRLSIGPVTSDTLRAVGYPPHGEATEASVFSLAEAVIGALRSRTRA